MTTPDMPLVKAVRHADAACDNAQVSPRCEPGVVAGWADLTVRDRVKRVCGLRHVLANEAQKFIDAITVPWRRDAAESLAAEIIPLADACLFLEREAARLLRPRRLGSRGRPLWLWGTHGEVHREPWGRVLIIGPGNYPLMLPGIQTIQALVAGNSVLLKPAPGCGEVARVFADALYDCGVPRTALRILDDTVEAAQQAMQTADKVVLTGSAATGRMVMRALADRLTPCTMELSGCDAVYIMERADLDLAVRAIVFGLTFNVSATCVAPRRIFVHQNMADDVAGRLVRALSAGPRIGLPPSTAARINDLASEALSAGATLIHGRLAGQETTGPLLLDQVQSTMRIAREDLMAPIASIVRVDSDSAALMAANDCPYRLGATVFGPIEEARKLASQIDAGCVIINDMIVPTADPRIPFVGRGESGFGATRGEEGLLEMTQAKTVIIRKGGFMPYLAPSTPQTDPILRRMLRIAHLPSILSRMREGAALLFRTSNRPPSS